MTPRIDITFPEVLDRLDYPNRVTAAPVTIDAVAWITSYFQEMTGGVEYERFAQEELAKGSLNALSSENFSNIRNVSGRGWSGTDVEPLFGKAIPELERIPVAADVFKTKEFDRDVARAVHSLCQVKGIEIANATKLLYQKRPRLIPILDSYARQALNLPWNDDYSFEGYRSVVAGALWNIRDIERRNSDELKQLENWLNRERQVTHGLKLSRLRIVDILAWGIIHQR